MANHLLERSQDFFELKIRTPNILAASSVIQVLIVDDEPVVRVGLRMMLADEEAIEVSDTASSVEEATSKIQKNRPDVVLMPPRIPEGGEARSVVELRRIFPDLRILVFASHQADEDVICTFQAGAMGYLLKNSPQKEIVQAIKMVRDDTHYVPPDIQECLLQGISSDKLSKREVEVLTLVAKGMSNREIAKRLFISEKTARNHVASCIAKLESGNRTEAVTTALQRGLITLTPGKSHHP